MAVPAGGAARPGGVAGRIAAHAWVGALAIGLAGCCSSAVLDRAREHERALRSELVPDRNPDAPPADACSDVPLVTLDDIERGARDGELVALDGLPAPAAERTCTLMLCTDDCDRRLPCCNACHAGLRLIVPGGRSANIELTGKGLGCHGYDCAMNCDPFGARPKRSYRFVGRIQRKPARAGFFNFTFHAERWCHLPGAV